MGLTPGKTTRADAERVLGQPVNKVSETLIQYKLQQNAERIFVQYRDNSPAAIVERIELTCGSTADTAARCTATHDSILDKYSIELRLADAVKWSSETKTLYYFGNPRYMVFTKTPSPSYEIRWAFYSKEWFESVAPKAGGCTGTILGDWETNRGRTTIVRLGRPEKGEVSLEQLIEGTYSLNNGTFTGTRGSSGTIRGEWKDNTGTGKMVIMSTRPGEFTGEWTRTTGSGPAEGHWEGRCVEPTSGGNY